MSDINILGVPTLRRSLQQASKILCQSHHEAILLKLPRSMQTRLAWLEEGLPYQEFVRDLKASGDIPEPFNAWEYYAQPILKSLPLLKQESETRIYCYENPSYVSLSTELAVRVARLTFRAVAGSGLELEDWRKVLKEDIQISKETGIDEVDYIGSVVDKHNEVLCVMGLYAESYGKILESRGFDVKYRYLDLPYQLLPLDALKAEFEREESELSEERIRELVRYHAEYVREFVLRYRTLDDAYFKWKAKHRNLTSLVEIPS